MVHVNIGVINTDTEPTVHEKAAAILIYNTRITSTAPSGPVTSFCVIFFERCRDTNIKTLVWQSLEVPERHSFTWMSVRSATRLDFGGGRDAKDSKRSKDKMKHCGLYLLCSKQWILRFLRGLMRWGIPRGVLHLQQRLQESDRCSRTLFFFLSVSQMVAQEKN